MLRKIIGTTAWVVATAITAAIMAQAMGTQSVIITAIGVLGIIASSTGVYLARDAYQDRAAIACVLSLFMWLVGAAFLIPSEINFWASTVTARAEREADIQRQAEGRRRIVDDTAKRLEKPARSPGEVQAAIDAELARTFGSGKKTQTLAALTKECTDLASPLAKHCGTVLILRKEKAASEEYKQGELLVWNATARLAVDTNETHGAHDGAARIAKILGGKAEEWEDRLLLVMVILLAFMRDMSLFLAWRGVRLVPEQVATAPTVKPETDEPKKRDWTKPETYQNVPEIAAGEVKQVSPFHAEINRMAGEICDEERAISSEQAHKRITAVARQHQEAPWKQKAVTTALRKACLAKGFRIESAMRGRGYRITGRVKEPSHFSQGVLLPA